VKASSRKSVNHENENTMTKESLSTSHSARSIPGAESGSVEAPNNETSSHAGSPTEVDRCVASVNENEESLSPGEGSNATPSVAHEDAYSMDEQSVANPSEIAVLETESISLGEMPADSAAVLTAEGRKIVTIEPAASVTRRRLSVGRALLVVAAEHQARVAASNGALWTVGQAHIDSPKSSKYGISLTAGLQALGIAQLQRGDLVQIEIGRGDTCYRVTGRASRKAAVYAAKTDLAQAGVELHTPFHYVVLGVVSESQMEGRQS